MDYWGKQWYLDVNSPRNIRTVLWIESLVSNQGYFPIQYCSVEEYVFACICPVWNLVIELSFSPEMRIVLCIWWLVFTELTCCRAAEGTVIKVAGDLGTEYGVKLQSSEGKMEVSRLTPAKQLARVEVICLPCQELNFWGY